MAFTERVNPIIEMPFKRVIDQQKVVFYDRIFLSKRKQLSMFSKLGEVICLLPSILLEIGRTFA